MLTAVIIVLVLLPVAVYAEAVKPLGAHIAEHLYGADQYGAAAIEIHPIVVRFDDSVAHRRIDFRVLRAALLRVQRSVVHSEDDRAAGIYVFTVAKTDRAVAMDPEISAVAQLPDRLVYGDDAPPTRDPVRIEIAERSPATADCDWNAYRAA